MNLQETLRDAIKDKIVTGYENSSTDISSAAKSCAEIAESNAIEFAEWVNYNCVRCSPTEFTCRLDNYATFISTKSLYQLFLNRKDND